jgi:hypothetical protein
MPHTPIGPTATGDTTESDPDGFPLFAPFDAFRDIEPPEYIVDGLIEDRALSAVIGAPGAGKSFVVLDIACSIASGSAWKGRPVKRTRVLYVAGEGVSGASQRIKAWETQHGIGVGQDLFMIPEATLLATKVVGLWEWIAANVKANGIGLVIFDTLARMAIGLDENSSQDMGRAVGMFDKLRRSSGAGVLLVHHTKAGADTGRGSSSLLGALDSEVLVRKVEDDEDDQPDDGSTALEVVSTKQKNAPIGQPIPVWLRTAGLTAIVTDASGGVGDDPFAAMILRPQRIRSSVDELTVRAWHALDDFPTTGLTRAELVDVLSEDRDMEPPTKPDMLRAIEVGTRTGILMVEGSKIKRSFNTLEHARANAGLLA